MNLPDQLASASVEIVRAELLKTDCRMRGLDSLRLEPLAANANRQDHLSRMHFRASTSDRPICHLIIDHNLASLRERTQAFAEACPEIACRPLFFHSSEKWDYLGIEFFAGRDLDTLARESRLTAVEALKHASKIIRALERTLQPSTKEAATQELEALFNRVRSLPTFSDFDRSFLESAVFPFVRLGALAGPHRTRWTNGDLIPANVLLDHQGDLRVVDYEFASRTHFFAEDAWRWRTFSSFPDAARKLPGMADAVQQPWLEAFFILKQFLLAHEINGLKPATELSRPAIARLLVLVGTVHSGPDAGMFLRSFTALSAVPQLEGKLQEKEREIEEKEREIDEKEQEIYLTVRESSELATLLQQREDKIARMQESFSWQATAWLRALRRKLIDPYSASPSASLNRQTQSPSITTELHFHSHLDSPQSWRSTNSRLSILGWCFAEESIDFKMVRACISHRTYDGIYGLERADVGQRHANYPQALKSGFKIEIEVRPGDKIVELALGDSNGGWHGFYHCNLDAAILETIRGTYAHWVRRFDTPTLLQLDVLRQRAAMLPAQPLISIVMPVYNTPGKFLTRAIESVRAQIYPKWELCIADDASTEPHVRLLLERWARDDSRIKVIFREKNGHIAAASNSALSLATGEFIGLLDHDDELGPHALAEVVHTINRHPDAQLIYSDEDMIDAEGTRFNPYFKPDFLPDLLIGHNYLCHFCVYKTEAIRAVGGWRQGFDGAQDWDLELRVIERTKAEHIVHIPRILYHWRAVAGSTALATSEKDYVIEAARKALCEHFGRCGEKAELIHLPGNHWRAKPPLPQPAPLVSLIIPSRNGLQFLRRCVDSILQKTAYPHYEILIIDNGSDDEAALNYLKSFSDNAPLSHPKGTNCSVRVLSYPHPFNYSALNNFGVKEARGEFVALLNNDLEVITPEWLEEMVAQAARPGVGCVGAMLYFPNDTLQHAGVVLGIGGVAGHAFKGHPRGTPGFLNRAHLVQNYSAVTGACLVVRKSTYEAVGGLDEEHLGVALNDVDFCLKVRAAGFRNLWTPFAELYHHESASRGYEDTEEKNARFRSEREVMKRRWREILANDPAYNPNLTLAAEDFALAYPPRVRLPVSIDTK